MPTNITASPAPFASGPDTQAPADAAAHRAGRWRAFNRFYTRHIGALDEHLLASGFSLAESRVLWELAQQPGQCAADLARGLQLDPGYLSRLLAGLKARRLLRSQPDPGDGRLQRLSLSAAGLRARAPLEQKAQAQALGALDRLGPAGQRRLLAAMAQIESLLGEAPRRAEPWLLRRHQAGDLGWIVGAHGAQYAREFGWDPRFEALVARIAADFIDQFQPQREACWLAERRGPDGEAQRLGSVLLVQARAADGSPVPGVAQLRLLLVQPAARGQGVGARLVAECTHFARQTGYGQIQLWTQSLLQGARRLYAAEGYQLVSTEPHHSFGQALTGEMWTLAL